MNSPPDNEGADLSPVGEPITPVPTPAEMKDFGEAGAALLQAAEDSLAAPGAKPITDIAKSASASDTLQQQAAADALNRIREAHQLDVSLRRIYVPRLFALVAAWLIFVAVMVTISTCRTKSVTTTTRPSAAPQGVVSVIEERSTGLETTVVVTLLGTSLGTVAGLFLVAAGWLFPKRAGRDN